MAWQHTQTRQERGYGREWQWLRQVILKRDKRLCQPCLAAGYVTAATEVDHIVSKAEGGTDDKDNLQSICTPCHRGKTQAEAKRAQGCRDKPTIGVDGWPIMQ